MSITRRYGLVKKHARSRADVNRPNAHCAVPFGLQAGAVFVTTRGSPSHAAKPRHKFACAGGAIG